MDRDESLHGLVKKGEISCYHASYTETLLVSLDKRHELVDNKRLN